MIDRARPIALGAAAVLIVGDLVIRGLAVSTLGGDLATFGTALLAAALGCVSGLLARRAPSGAILAAGAAAWLGALDLVGIAQTERATVEAAAWRPWVAVAEIGLLGASAVAAMSVGSLLGRLPRRWRPVLGGLAVAGFAGISLLAAFTVARPPDAGPDGIAESATIRASGRAALGFSAASLVTAFGLLASAPLGRAWTRSGAMGEGSPGTGRARGFARALLDEVPGRPGPDRIAEEERARLAADIHAHLLPGLRRAANAADEAGAPDAVVRHLREAVSDAETLMDARQSVVLEQFGLVPALELLAERTERRGFEVTIDLDDAPDPVSLPSDVARAALRVAMLAADNAVRHSSGTRIAVAFRAEAGVLRLTVSDDGVGIDVSDRRAGGRGLGDMAAEARRIGASLAIEPYRSPETGTRVELRWPAPVAGDPASSARDLPSGHASVDA